MSLDALMVHQVTILTPATTTNRYGDDQKDWANAERTDTKAWVSQRSSLETVEHREGFISDWVIYLPPDVAITGRDRVEWGDITFEVISTPLPAHTPRGLHHYEAQLRVVEG